MDRSIDQRVPAATVKGGGGESGDGGGEAKGRLRRTRKRTRRGKMRGGARDSRSSMARATAAVYSSSSSATIATRIISPSPRAAGVARVASAAWCGWWRFAQLWMEVSSGEMDAMRCDVRSFLLLSIFYFLLLLYYSFCLFTEVKEWRSYPMPWCGGRRLGLLWNLLGETATCTWKWGRTKKNLSVA